MYDACGDVCACSDDDIEDEESGLVSIVFGRFAGPFSLSDLSSCLRFRCAALSSSVFSAIGSTVPSGR